MKLVFRPDCADLPYFLRAYFAFKMGLPFGYSKCSRGGGGKPPQCFAWCEHSECRCGSPRPVRTKNRVERTCSEAAGASGIVRQLYPDRRRRRPFRNRANGAERQQHRLLSGAVDAGDAAPGHRVRRSVRAHSGARAARAAVGRRGAASSSPSTGSPTGRSRASAFGAAISCSRRIPRSAAPGSSASGRSCSGRTAPCGG